MFSEPTQSERKQQEYFTREIQKIKLRKLTFQWFLTVSWDSKICAVCVTALTKLCIVRGISSRTSTRSSSPTRGVISVSQSVNLFRLQNRQRRTENLSWYSINIFVPHSQNQLIYLWTLVNHCLDNRTTERNDCALTLPEGEIQHNNPGLDLWL